MSELVEVQFITPCMVHICRPNLVSKLTTVHRLDESEPVRAPASVLADGLSAGVVPWTSALYSCIHSSILPFVIAYGQCVTLRPKLHEEASPLAQLPLRTLSHSVVSHVP